ncbi:hypothetical protein TEA_029458 [Camellia sinensis var. sinensis]|uniref:Uncharacterized protein n=1 Tax=Camellia sinensis var. sinensis TaxID=542762 RepID=A0A4S4ETT9_CAMSN|nr:hypothetical protein TEA_029458 [Camellia sinensis var. sinensis]
MPGKLEELIENINGSDNDKIPCIVADELLGWALEVAEKMQIKRAAFWSTATALLALGFRIPELLDDGIIKNNESFTVHDQWQRFTITVHDLFRSVIGGNGHDLFMSGGEGGATTIGVVRERVREGGESSGSEGATKATAIVCVREREGKAAAVKDKRHCRAVVVRERERKAKP